MANQQFKNVCDHARGYAFFEWNTHPSYPTHSEFEPEDEYYSDKPREDDGAEYEDEERDEIDRGRPLRPQNNVVFVTVGPSSKLWTSVLR
jgi:hypothetical protein